MQKIFRFFLASSRKRRYVLISVVLWLLRVLRDIEKDEMQRHSDRLDSLDEDIGAFPSREYNTIEEEYLYCEYILGVLDSVIEDIEFAY